MTETESMTQCRHCKKLDSTEFLCDGCGLCEACCKCETCKHCGERANGAQLIYCMECDGCAECCDCDFMDLDEDDDE